MIEHNGDHEKDLVAQDIQESSNIQINLEQLVNVA